MHGGLTPYEIEIMDLWDGGSSVMEIHRRLRKPLKKIRSTISLYHAEHEQRDDEKMVSTGSAQLLEALKRTSLSHQPTGEQHG